MNCRRGFDNQAASGADHVNELLFGAPTEERAGQMADPPSEDLVRSMEYKDRTGGCQAAVKSLTTIPTPR